MTKEQFFLEMENRTKEFEEIQEKLREISAKNEEYDRLIKRRLEIRDVVEWYQKLTDKTTSYKEFIWAYERYLEYSKEHNLEEIPSFSDKISFLKKHYRKEELFSVNFNYYPPNLWDNGNVFGGGEVIAVFIEDDFENVLKYFGNKKEKDVYKWEFKYARFLLFYDQVCQTSYAIEFFGNYKELEKTKECEEYVNNCDKLIKDLKNNTFSFNLLLWTVFKIYHYFRNKNSEFIVDKSDLVLIDRLITISFKIVKKDLDKITIKESKILDENEKDFIFSLSQLLCLDLLHTINIGFPDYYDTCIMFLGCGLHIPAGCSDLYASMKSFEGYVNGITNYDYWLDWLEPDGGPEVFEKMNIKHDYKDVLTDNELI